MSEDIRSDDEDTISVPLPEVQSESGTVEERELQAAELDLLDVRAAMETMERTLAVAMVAYEELKRVVFGDEQAVVHACPSGSTLIERLPCCGRSMIDVPLTERISLDGTAVTCTGPVGTPSPS